MSLNHYNSISKDFEENWFFTKEYFPTLAKAIIKSLKLEEEDTFVDLGCGTGNYTREIVDNSVCSIKKVVGVDFSKNMVEQFCLKNSTYSGVCSDLESFVSSTQESFDKILLKEVIHHVQDYNQFYSGLNKILNPSGKILIVTRPEKTNFPFFEKALDYFSANQVSESEIKSGLERAGFSSLIEKLNIDIRIGKSQLFKMIENRFMSTFNHFTDDEIKLGLGEVDQKYSGLSEIKFCDELIFISAIKN